MSDVITRCPFVAFVTGISPIKQSVSRLAHKTKIYVSKVERFRTMLYFLEVV